MVDFENPWLFGAVVVGIWAVIWTALSVVFFDGNALGAAVQGGAGGVAFTATYLYVTRND
ncbi:hypothetical protein [Halorussus litoreus]|uniref:hypothetical protein n=1 Tax=Halorussus litoreus TaxID=1710536 RepID=UPI0013006736|nr:hypothetical protein [Halorussus litoreus]